LRRGAVAAATVAVVLGFGLLADWSVRDRLANEISQSFRATGTQADRTIKIVIKLNDAISTQAKLFPALVELSAFREESEFGLGAPEVDAHNLEAIQAQIASADWRFAREMTASQQPSHIAVGDYKGRLLYTSAAPQQFPRTDLLAVPWIRDAVQGGGKNMRLVRNDDPRLVATKLLGPDPKPGVSVVFTHTGAGGNGLFMQVLDADEVLNNIELDDTTMLSIVGPDGVRHGTVPDELLQLPLTDDIHEVALGSQTYQMLARPILGPDGQLVGHIVMAGRLDGVLSLFTNARLVFTLAMLAALAAAIAMAVRARQLASRAAAPG
jgi:hypothetical protein